MCYDLGLETSVELLSQGIQPGAKSVGSQGMLQPEMQPIPYQFQKQVRNRNNSNENLAEILHEARLFALQTAWLERMLETSAPREKLVLFWHGMLTSAYGKVRVASYMVRQNHLFRRMAFGDYRELIKQVVMDPAMIIYLDIDKNKRTKPNENFARELLELFTLGEGNYKPKDIKKLAKQIVGFRLRRPEDTLKVNEKTRRGMEGSSGFRDMQRRLSRVIDEIFSRPKAGELLCLRLWKFYLSMEVDHGAVKQMARLLKDSHWQLKPVLRQLWMSELFFSEAVMAQQIKSPVQYLIQGHRELGAQRLDPGCAYFAMNRLGQQLFNPPNVAGWPAGTTWVNGNSLAARYQLSIMMSEAAAHQAKPMSAYFYKRLMQDRVAGLVKMMDHFFPVTIPVEKARVLLNVSKEVKSVADVEKLIRYMMCMPEYQVC